VYLITGKINHQKTTKTIEIANKILSSDGFVSLKTMDQGNVVKFDVMKLSTKETKLLAMTKPYFNHQFNYTQELGPYVFNDEAFHWVENEMLMMINNHVKSLFLDEVGKLEIDGYGFYQTIIQMLYSERDCYFTIRDQFIPMFLEKFKIKSYQILT
jgi:nucleoside-triphosphatase THEP1